MSYWCNSVSKSNANNDRNNTRENIFNASSILQFLSQVPIVDMSHFNNKRNIIRWLRLDAYEVFENKRNVLLYYV